MANNIIIQTAKADNISVLSNNVTLTSAVSSLDFSSDFTVTNSGNNISISLPPPVSNVNTLYRHNGATTQTLSNTLSTIIRFDTNVITDSDYTYNNGSITFNRSGRYKISYDISINVSVGTTRSISESTINYNGTDSVGGRSYGYHRRNAAGENTSSATVILNINAFDFISIQSRRIAGTNTLVTLANACRLTIERLS